MQDFLAGICVVVALIFVFRMLRGLWRHNCGCSGCPGCGGKGQRSAQCVENRDVMTVGQGSDCGTGSQRTKDCCGSRR